MDLIPQGPFPGAPGPVYAGDTAISLTVYHGRSGEILRHLTVPFGVAVAFADPERWAIFGLSGAFLPAPDDYYVGPLAPDDSEAYVYSRVDVPTPAAAPMALPGPLTVTGLPAGAWVRYRNDVMEATSDGSVSVSLVQGPAERITVVGKWRAAALLVECLALNDFKLRIRARVTEQEAFWQANGCVTSFGDVQTDPASRQNVQELAIRALIQGSSFTTSFTLLDNTKVTLSAAGMLALAATVSQYIDDCHQHAVALKVQIDGAADGAALFAIDPAAGWSSISNARPMP